MKMLFSIVAVGCLAAALWFRFTGRIGDSRDLREKSLTAAYSAMTGGVESANTQLKTQGIPVRIVKITRDADRITVRCSVTSTRPFADSAVMRCTRDCAGEAFADAMPSGTDYARHADEFGNASVIHAFEDTDGKFLRKTETPLLSWAAGNTAR